VLADMQARLARSPYDALNIQAGAVGPAEVRAAFLELTKTFHPAKFARMSAELQKFANEVFLGLRAAHDQLAHPKTVARTSGPFVPSKTPTTPTRQPTPPTARANVPPAPTSAINPPTQRGVPPAPTSAINPPTQRGVSPAPTSAINPATQRGVSPAPTQTQRLPATTPARPVATPPRPGAPVAPNHRPGNPAAQQVRRVTPAGGVPVPPAGPRPAAPQPSKAAPTAEPELAGVYDLLEKGQWEQARTTLNALVALQPKPRYRALIEYSRGREAQLAQRREDAREQLLGALEIDPDLELAKTALAELFRRK